MLALSATNLAETASDRLEAETVADIYVGMSLRIKESCPNLLQFFARYVIEARLQREHLLQSKLFPLADII